MKFDRSLIGKVFAEYVGTFTLAGVIIVMAQTIGQPFLTGIAAALVLATFVTTVGSVSGAHLNPAVTLGLFSLRKVKALDAAAYLVFQFLGAFSALKLVEYMYGQRLPGDNFKGDFDMKVFLAELIGTAVFTFGIASVVNRKIEGYQGAAAIGTSLFMGIMIASMGSSSVINPAVALGANTFNLNYLFGPLVGALLAMNLQNLLTSPPVDAGAEATNRPLRKATAQEPSVNKKVSTKKKTSKK